MMTKHDILRTYHFNATGIITTPGKFQGGPIYGPYFYEIYLDGGDMEILNEGILIEVELLDILQFPELENVKYILLDEDEQGFVWLSEVCTEEEANAFKRGR